MIDYTNLKMSVINPTLFVSNCLLMLTLLTSCNSSNNTEDLRKEIQSVSSWAATSQMVGNAWLKGNIPNKYAQKTLNKAQREFLKEQKKISQIQPSTNLIQYYQSLMQTHLSHLANQTEKMSKAIDQNNHSLAQQEIKEIEIEVQKLNQLRTIPEAGYEKNI
ncbi:MAG: hypothetical protein NHB32_18190 [Fischerella sp. CENA71]|nr:hypothetical protein [Fischerella sp. CENA71]